MHAADHFKTNQRPWRTSRMTRRAVPLAGVALALLLLLAFQADIFAQGTPLPSTGISFGVSPPRTDVTLSPGEAKSVTASITNLSDVAYNVTIATTDFTVADTAGTVALRAADASNPRGLGAFMRIVGPTSVTLGPGKRYVAQVDIKVPAGSPGGTRFGAVVFSGGPAAQPGRVTLVSQLASLVVGRVRGVSLAGSPGAPSQIVVTLPVRDTRGAQVVMVNDPATGITLNTREGTTLISIPIADQGGARRGTMTIQSKQGTVTSATGTTVAADNVRVDSIPQDAVLDGKDGRPGAARVGLAFDLNNIVARSALKVAVSSTLEPQLRAAISTAASALSTDAPAVAYALQVTKNNLQDSRDVANARVTMAVSKDWADRQYSDLVRIIRYADDGSVQVLDTFLVGMEDGLAIFAADSPRGLSAFALAGFKKQVPPLDLPPGTMPIPTGPLISGASTSFDLALSPEIQLSDRATASDSQGNAAEIIPGGKAQVGAEAIDPGNQDFKVNLASPRQTGKLEWVKVPSIALAGSNTLTLRFDNTGDADYEVRPGLARVVGVRGKTDVDMQIPNFNAFPGASRDVELDWVTSSRAFGRYTIAAQTTFGDPPQMAISAPVSVWVIPWKWILSLLLVAGGLAAIAWMITRTVREYIERQVQARMGSPAGAGGPGGTPTPRSPEGGPAPPNPPGDNQAAGRPLTGGPSHE